MDGLNAQNTVAVIVTSRSLSAPRQLRVHRQREKELSALSRALDGRTEVAQHLQRWQNLLTAHSLELAELINNLDEEAATDIRKVHFTRQRKFVCRLLESGPALDLFPPGSFSLATVARI